MAFLEIKDLNKKVNEINILSDVNLSFDKTGLVFIVGKSGAGKSTLMNIIGQLDREYTGQIFLDGKECEKDQDVLCEIRRDKIGFVFQDFNLLGDLTVDENIWLATQLANCSAVSVDGILSTFNISDSKQKKCNILSGGERQRVAIARAICKDSKIILADEPTGNLDYANAKQVFDVLRQISTERLVIVISHDMEAATQYADRIISIADGKVISDENLIREKVVKKMDDFVSFSIDVKSKNIFWTIVREHLKQNRKRNRMIVCICSILLFFTTLIVSLINAMLNVNSSINAVTENDKVEVYCTREYRLASISDAFLEEVSDAGCNQIMGYHQLDLGVWLKNDVMDIKYQVYENNRFFKERLGFYDIELPDDRYDIIVNESFAQNVFGTTECVGESFWLSALGQKGLECKVYAVTEMLEEDEAEICITKETLDELYKTLLSGPVSFISYSESKMNYAHMHVIEYTEQDKLCYGRKPEKANEIVINAGGVNSIMSVLELPYASVSVEDILNGKISDEVINEILGGRIDISVGADSSYFENLEIVGITENVDSYVYVSMKKAGIENILKPSVDYVEIYLSNRGKNLEKVTNIVEKYGYKLSDKGGAKADLMASRLSVPVFIIAILSVVIFISTFLFVKLTTKINILNQKQEIGIIQALGGSDKQIKNIYLLENLIVLLYSLIPVLLIAVILQIAGSKGLLMYQGIRLYEMNIMYMLLVCFGGIITIWVASLMEVGKIANLNTVDVLRKSR